MPPTEGRPAAPAQAGDGLDEVSAEAVRRLLAMVSDRISHEARDDLVRGFVAGEVLARRPASSAPATRGAVDALLADLVGALLVEQSRRQGNRTMRSTNDRSGG